jgi:hypothetical protein
MTVGKADKNWCLNTAIAIVKEYARGAEGQHVKPLDDQLEHVYKKLCALLADSQTD